MKVNGEDLSTTEKNVNEIEYHNSLTKIFKKIFITKKPVRVTGF